MAQDGAFRGAGSAVVHQLRPSVQSPQRCGAHLIRGGVSSALHGDAIAGAESVQQEIAVRVDQLVSQSFGYLELPTIDLGSGRRRPDGSDVAEDAADLRKDLLASACVGRSRNRLIAGWRLGGANEVDKSVQVRETVAVTFVFRIGQSLVLSDGLAQGSVLGREIPVGDSLLIRVGVGGKRNYAGVLALPAKAAHPEYVACLHNGHHNRHARDTRARFFRLAP